jgi:Holliday junction resolvasome RuvABC endonuclease subunit
MILAIDPSINSLGWATFDRNVLVGSKQWEHGTIRPPALRTIPHILNYISKALNEAVTCGERPTKLIIEYPQFFASSEKGATAAVQGTTFGLAAIAGHLQGYYQMKPIDVIHYTPSQWKGQVPKNGMMYRFEKRFGYVAPNDHEAEAMLMLDYYLNQ